MFAALQSVENTAGEVNATAETLSLLTGMRHKQNSNSPFCVTAAPHEPKTGKKNGPVSIAMVLAPVLHPRRATETLEFDKKKKKI